MKPGEYDPDKSDEYIKRLIREDKVSDSSVVIVLVGPNTRKRKHVDWEIYAGLRSSVNGSYGLVGIMLPELNELPHSCVKQYDTIRIEENDGLLMFYKADTGELIHKCRKSAEEGGDIPYKDDAIDIETVGENAMRRVFDDVEDVESFIAMLREQNGRYANSQMNKIVSLAKVYTVDQVESAILYCIRVKKCSLNEVQAYLLYRYGLGMAKRKMTENTFYHCKKRAEEIAEEQNGRLD